MKTRTIAIKGEGIDLTCFEVHDRLLCVRTYLNDPNVISQKLDIQLIDQESIASCVNRRTRPSSIDAFTPAMHGNFRIRRARICVHRSRPRTESAAGISLLTVDVQTEMNGGDSEVSGCKYTDLYRGIELNVSQLPFEKYPYPDNSEQIFCWSECASSTTPGISPARIRHGAQSLH